MKNLTLILLSLAFVSFSCKKEDSTSKAKVPLIKQTVFTYSYQTDTVITVYDHDSQGRTIKSVSTIGESYTFEYSNLKIVCKYYETDVLDETDTYTLNSNGWVDEISSVYATSGSIDTEADNISKYFYDEQGHLIKMTSSGNYATDTTFWFYSDDNYTLSVQRRWINGTLYCDSITYEFFADKISTISADNYGQPFYGKPAKNLPKKSITKYGATGNTYATEFEYVFDSKDRVIKQTRIMEGTNGEALLYIDFTYVE